MQNNLRKEFIVGQAFCYIFAGLFFLTLNDLPRIWFFRVIGILFLAVSLILVISPTCDRLLPKAEWINKQLNPVIINISLAMIVAALITLIDENGGESTWLVWVPACCCVAFMFLFIVQSFWGTKKSLVAVHRIKKTKDVAIEVMALISMELGAASIAAVAFEAFSIEIVIGLLSVSLVLLLLAYSIKLKEIVL